MTTAAPARQRRWLVGTLVACVIAFAVQQTAIVPAVQDVQQELHAGKEWTAWLVTVYLMVATVATPALGRVADLYGRRRVLLGGLVLFGVFSAGAAVAPNLPVLLLFRSMQGVGGAVYPLTLAVARRTAGEHDAGASISMLAGSFGAGMAAGFVAGGALAEFVSWRAVFALGAVLVALAAVGVLRWIPSDGGGAAGGFDSGGTAVLGVAAIALLAGLTLVATLGAASPLTIALLAVALIGAAVWVRHERRTSNPLVDLHVLAKPRVAMANLATIGVGWTLFSTFLLVPEFARTPSGHTGYGLAAGAFVVGLLLALAAGQTITAVGAGRIHRVPPRGVFAGGLLLIAAATGILAVTRHDDATVAGALFLMGTGSGFALQSASAVSTQQVSDDVAAVSASLNSTVRRLSGGIGGQIATIVLVACSVAATGRPSFRGFEISYAVAGFLCLAGAVALLVPTPGAGGDEPPGKK